MISISEESVDMTNWKIDEGTSKLMIMFYFLNYSVYFVCFFHPLQLLYTYFLLTS